MAMNIIALVLVLAIVFMNSLFGFYSGLINVFCCIFAASMAFGFYEALNSLLTGSFGLHSAYTEPAALVLIYVVTLILARTLSDKFLRGNVQVPQALNLGGSIACGIVIAQVTVGILCIGVMMLPLGGAPLQFSRYLRVEGESDPDQSTLVKFERQSLWTRSDEFAVGLFNILSHGSLSGGTAFSAVYPDYTEAIYFSTNTVQPESTPAALRIPDKREDGFAALKLDTWWEQTSPLEGRYRKEAPTAENRSPRFDRIDAFAPASGNKFIGARMTLGKAAADLDDRTRMHVFRPTMIRIVGKVGSQPAHYVARVIGNADEKLQGANRIVDFDNNFALRDTDPTIEVYFEVDQEFTPDFVEYRRHARAATSAANKAEKPPEVALSWGGPTPTGEGDAGERSGQRLFGRVAEGGSGQNKALPFELSAEAMRKMPDVKLEGGKLAGGRFFAARSRVEKPEKAEGVVDFGLPESHRIVQVRYKPRKVRTVAGQVFNYVARVNQYKAVDENGNSYNLSGYYGIVRRGQADYIEFFFNGAPGSEVEPSYNYMLDFKNIEPRELNDDDNGTIGLIFVVPPNVKIVRIENQTKDGVDVSYSVQ